MESEVSKFFPDTEFISGDGTGQQYMVTFDGKRFWLAVPVGRELTDLHFIFIFSGRGGSGRRNNLTGGEVQHRFLNMMLKEGFAFICAECSPDAWADMESTDLTFESWEYCRRQGLDIPEKIDLMGFSMGGLGALMYAARKVGKVRKVVDVFGVTDLVDFCEKREVRAELKQLTAAERLDRSPCAKADLYKDADILIIHGDKDASVDISQSARFYELLKARDFSCRYIVVPDMGHNNAILGNVDTQIRDFFAG